MAEVAACYRQVQSRQLLQIANEDLHDSCRKELPSTVWDKSKYSSYGKPVAAPEDECSKDAYLRRPNESDEEILDPEYRDGQTQVTRGGGDGIRVMEDVRVESHS